MTKLKLVKIFNHENITTMGNTFVAKIDDNKYKVFEFLSQDAVEEISAKDYKLYIVRISTYLLDSDLVKNNLATAHASAGVDLFDCNLWFQMYYLDKYLKQNNQTKNFYFNGHNFNKMLKEIRNNQYWERPQTEFNKWIKIPFRY